ncbi:uncharacterized protein A1O9_02054 [Exophiala aquamarina CBS 119918]|uniref:Leucine carboxyl methyltransferase 1 n=1 Tax=Exophiala aquamarina CBS 119918 TaxID=1182545 RepID=A0A072PMC6_9EURO|nr:uncharacterized protein A1O9_02054 [Exophiala aquamarina CBS 119918]KEF60493.1 hypothetical protein A1O9_02054 [Exophiala aquamarina CBS 119918]
MSAPHIPNLNSLRRGPRGRGRGLGDRPGGVSHKHVDHDQVVRNTDNDAATSRLSAVEAGYLEDPFARLLAPGDGVQRRLPLMNRGTYVRTAAIDKIVYRFLSSRESGRKQIISLGAGSDTRYFRLKQKQRGLDLAYHEIDFAANTQRKISHLRSVPFSNQAKSLCGIDLQASDVEVSQDRTKLSSTDYFIHPQDLRSLPKIETGLTGIDTSLPTLILSECCLIYLPPDDADSVLDCFDRIFPPTTPLAIVIYEPIRPFDAFGKTMVRNLMERGIQLQTLEKYSGLEEQRQRLNNHGFVVTSNGSIAGAEAADIDAIWHRWIDPEEKERIEGLEWMDEVEEFVLLAKHYCICLGWRGFGDGSLWSPLLQSLETGG